MTMRADFFIGGDHGLWHRDAEAFAEQSPTHGGAMILHEKTTRGVLEAAARSAHRRRAA